MRKAVYLLVVAVLLYGAPALAQGAFTDVPSDHWAYDAVDQLQRDGILIGYPDGTFGGKRMITRYEFAVALARIMGVWPGETKPGETPRGFVTQEQLNNAIAGVKVPSIENLATKADVDALRKLVDEFRDEIAALGVDVDALKRDVAALGARVEAVELEQKRVRITGDVTIFAVATSSTGKMTAMVDLDERTASGSAGNDHVLRSIGLVKDFDLKIVGRVGENTTANATINYGNYLNYVGFVDQFMSGNRPTGRTTGMADGFFPYYLYVETAMGPASICAGRFPLQFTPYTLKMIDVDSYTSILKTSDGNYPVDGLKVAFDDLFGMVDVTLFAAKNDSNAYLGNGLTGVTFSGLNRFYNIHKATAGAFMDQDAVGGLSTITQSAGGRVTAGIPWGGNVGVTYYQVWDKTRWAAGQTGYYDQARVYGADVCLPIPIWEALSFSGSYTRSETLQSHPRDNAEKANAALRKVGDITSGNTAAWDAKFNVGFGDLAAAVGYKEIGRNFSAAGAWDKIGRWTNPANVSGGYGEVSYAFGDMLKVMVNGEYLGVMEDMRRGPIDFGFKGDKIYNVEGGVKWAFYKNMALDLSYEWVRFDPTKEIKNAAGGIVRKLDSADADETYLTVGVSHELSPNAFVKIGYQMIRYGSNSKAKNNNVAVAWPGPYGSDYAGHLGVVQIGVSF